MPTAKHSATALLRNIIYPNYQLYAVAGNGKLTPEKTLVRCVLHTFSWLRARFRELECPTELVCPAPEESESVAFADFKSFELNVGYTLEIVCLQDEKVWTLRLMEPDRGATLTDGTKRAPVAGRIFETNIAFRLFDNKVECGFKTVISEREDTSEPCEVFRYALIRNLVEDKHIGLSHGAYRLGYEPLTLASAKDAQKLAKWLRDDRRMLPAVVLVQPDADEKSAPPPINFAKSEFSNILLAPIPTLPPIILSPVTPLPPKVPKKREQVGDWVPDVETAKRWRVAMGYAQVFALPSKYILELTKGGFPCKPGDVLFAEPQFSGEVVNMRGETDAQIDARITNYPVNKPIRYGNVMFVTEAKIVDLQAKIAGSSSREEMFADFELQKAALRNNFEEKQRENGLEIIALEKKFNSEREKREKAEAKSAQMQRDIDETAEKHSRELRRRDAEIEYLHSKESRPKKPQELAAWAAERFGEQLAIIDGNRIKWSDVGDVDLLCDALEYLATEYRGNLLGEISDDEMRMACSVKYGRGFDVSPVTGTTPDVYYNDYHVTYNGAERLLDRHLRFGNKAEYLIRIYFFYDKERKLLVIGSLPGHLRTVTYS
ncbi:MAG: hypothetical protein LBN30_08915 [Oscillospiraceae bacterium]|jgi:hypothetical protein|nr:hypothetical protein [Oscillospiraceae bacterium]